MKICQSFVAPLTFLLALAALHVSLPRNSEAGWGWPWAEEPCCMKCPNCHYTCKFSAKRVDEKRHRYVAEPKVICIPRVVFPWQTDNCHGCVNNGARLRCINVLKREYFTCSECNFSWSATKCRSDADCGSTNEPNQAAEHRMGQLHPIGESVNRMSELSNSRP